MKIIDAHTHVYDPLNSAAALFENADRFGYEKLNVASVPAYAGLSQNLACLCVKRMRPGKVYAFGGLEHESGRSFIEQAENMARMGFDGFKMIEGKPTFRHALKLALDDPALEGVYSFAEQSGLPLLLHAADPAAFWDEHKIPEWALSAGWLYGSDYESYETFYSDISQVLHRHPNLRIILAHFYFLSDDMPRAARFLDEHPDAYFDVTSGFEMYENFSKNIDGWREFFLRYADRILYGTDSTDSVQGQELENQRVINRAQLHFLAESGPCQAWDKTILGLQLPQDALDRILYRNFESLTSKDPLSLDMRAILDECVTLNRVAKHNPIEKARIGKYRDFIMY